MKIHKFTNPRVGFLVQCCVCSEWIPQTEAYFDSEGEPFKAYYCKKDLPQEPEELEEDQDE